MNALLLATFLLVAPPDWTAPPGGIERPEVAVYWWAENAQGQHLYSSTVNYMKPGEIQNPVFPLPPGTYYCVRAWSFDMRRFELTYAEGVCGEAH